MKDIDDLLHLEGRRCAAISTVDERALREMLAVDYVHVHATGTIDDRAGFIAGIVANPRVVERGNIAVRLYGETAILIGEQINRRGDAAATGILQQFAVLRDGAWQFVSAQVTLKPPVAGAEGNTNSR